MKCFSDRQRADAGAASNAAGTADITDALNAAGASAAADAASITDAAGAADATGASCAADASGAADATVASAAGTASATSFSAGADAAGASGAAREGASIEKTRDDRAPAWSGSSTIDIGKLARDLRVYAVTDRSWLNLAEDAPESKKQGALERHVRAALDGGATLVQMREKHLDHANMVAEAAALQKICHAADVPFIVNDAVDVALAMNADGLHIGQDDLSAQEARRLIGPDKILGVSAQTVEQALKAEHDGADYLGVGAVFPTNSKDDAVEVSRETLCAICRAVRIPVVAIGGITCENVSELAASGIVGVAVISAIFAQKDITAATKRLSDATLQLANAIP